MLYFKALTPLIALSIVVNERLNKLYEAFFELDVPKDRVCLYVE